MIASVIEVELSDADGVVHQTLPAGLHRVQTIHAEQDGPERLRLLLHLAPAVPLTATVADPGGAT